MRMVDAKLSGQDRTADMGDEGRLVESVLEPVPLCPTIDPGDQGVGQVERTKLRFHPRAAVGRAGQVDEVAGKDGSHARPMT